MVPNAVIRPFNTPTLCVYLNHDLTKKRKPEESFSGKADVRRPKPTERIVPDSLHCLCS
jgi:hypothetical protein